MNLFASVEKGLGLFQKSGVSSFLSPQINQVVQTATSLTRQTQEGVASPPVQGVPQGKPIVQANITEKGPASAGFSSFLAENRSALIVVGVVLVGLIIYKKVL